MKIYNTQPKIIAQPVAKSPQKPQSGFSKPAFTSSSERCPQSFAQAIRNTALGGLNVSFKEKVAKEQIEQNRRSV